MARWQDVNGIYQIYPRSFKDSNGDGVGDLNGIIDQLDYIKGKPDSLGIDAIWLSPFFRSPMADGGYDISDHYSVDPLFGDLDDFKKLIGEAHRRDIRVMVDYVPNHTSDQHQWFADSKSSRDNEKRDWYVWRDPKPDGSPPNNWLSEFGGSAWEFDQTTGQYYLHSFLSHQPDLNWDNPQVRQAMTSVLRFWLSLGVDGIRADAVRWISKDVEFRDDPPNPNFKQGDNPFHAHLQHRSQYGENLFVYLKEIASTIESYPDKIILFEDHIDTSMDRAQQYSAFYSVNPTVAAPFNFEGMDMPYSARGFATFITRFQKMAGGELGPFYCFGNHDESRLASRIGKEQARLVGLLQLTLPGIPVVYYGDELGMSDGAISDNEIQDPFEKLTPGMGLGRDPERTPMQWLDTQYGGFSDTKPWLPLGDDATTINVLAEQNDVYSSLAMYRELLSLRRSSVLRSGGYVEWLGTGRDVFGYIRENEYDSLLVLANMTTSIMSCTNDVDGEVIYSTHPSVETVAGEGIVLQPHQGVVIRRARS